MPVQLDQLWDDIRAELRSETPDFKFHIWIEPLELAALRGVRSAHKESATVTIRVDPPDVGT